MRIRLLNTVLPVLAFCLAMSDSVYAVDMPDKQPTDVIDMNEVRVMFRIKVLGFVQINGQFDRFTGTMMNDENGDPYGVSMRIDVSSINTNDNERDALLRGRDFFAADRYPHIAFNGSCTDQSADGHLRLTGVLELRGHSRQVVFDIIEIQEDNGINSYLAKAQIKRSEFGLNALKHIVSDDVEIIVDL